MSDGIPSAAEHERRAAWVARVRNLHRNKRLAALMGCAASIGLMLWGRGAGGPDWAITAGLALVTASWLLLIFVMVDRYRWVKRNPYRPGQS